MAIAYRSRSSAASTGGITLALPTGWQENDIFLILVETNGNEPPATPAGYTALSISPRIIGTETRLTAFWKRATASEANVTFPDAGNHIVASLIAFSGVITSGTPFDVLAGNSETPASTTANFPDITPTVGSAFVIHVESDGRDATTTSISSFSTPQLGEDIVTFSVRTNEGGGGGLDVICGTIRTLGVTVDSTASLVASINKNVMSIALIPDTSLGPGNEAVARVNLGAAVKTLPDAVRVSRTNLGVVVKIASVPSSSRRRGFMSFIP